MAKPPNTTIASPSTLPSDAFQNGLSRPSIWECPGPVALDQWSDEHGRGYVISLMSAEEVATALRAVVAANPFQDHPLQLLQRWPVLPQLLYRAAALGVATSVDPFVVQALLSPSLNGTGAEKIEWLKHISDTLVAPYKETAPWRVTWASMIKIVPYLSALWTDMGSRGLLPGVLDWEQYVRDRVAATRPPYLLDSPSQETEDIMTTPTPSAPGLLTFIIDSAERGAKQGSAMIAQDVVQKAARDLFVRLGVDEKLFALNPLLQDIANMALPAVLTVAATHAPDQIPGARFVAAAADAAFTGRVSDVTYRRGTELKELLTLMGPSLGSMREVGAQLLGETLPEEYRVRSEVDLCEVAPEPLREVAG